MKQRRIAKLLLCAAVLTALLLALLSGCGGKKPLATVYAASDFQPYYGAEDDTEQGQLHMQTILRQMKADGYTIDSALLCGDYSKTANTWENINVSLNNAGVAAIMDVLQAECGLSHDSTVFVQGNHDPADTEGLDPSGANDTEHYGVFVLHEDDFQWKQGEDLGAGPTKSGNDHSDSKEAALTAAAALEAYLRDKESQQYSKPIFICSHIPLHFSYRTQAMSSMDNIYAELIFDVLNDYGTRLDIIFLFGHNHSDTHDDYLGGSAVYLPAGDPILIPDGEDWTTFREHTLTFTYLNAGYLGYYDGRCATGGLTSTVLRIFEDRVEIARYTYEEKDGTSSARLTNLKEAGIWDKDHIFGDFTKKKNTTSVYESIQTVLLKTAPGK